MVSTRVFLGVVAVFAVVTAGLLAGLNEQRGMIYLNPSTGARVSTALSGGSEFFGGVFAAEEVTDNTLFVSGSATASDNPDQVTIMFSVETEDASARVSQQENAGITSDVRAALISRGIESEDIETTGYSLYQIREYEPESRKYIDRGFRTTHSMQVEISDIEGAGGIIDAAVLAGANRINGVYFGLSDSKMDELRMAALKAASENARERADAIAEGLGITVTRVMSVSEGYSYAPVARAYAQEMATVGDSSVSTEITPGDVQVSATINVVFEIA
jgi:uncharacterized protein YggE